MKKILLLLLTIGIFFVSCDEFLDEPPTKSSAKTLDSAEDLDKLFNNLTYSYYSYPDFFCTDNFEIPLEVYDELPNVFPYDILQEYLFQPTVESASDYGWDRRYRTIWNTNLAIQVINEQSITGSADLMQRLKAEAHFIRATEYFALVMNYCLHPTEANADEPGLPLRTETNFEEDLSRSSLKETYDFIKADLEEAFKLNVPYSQNWRASTPAVHAFAARFYLYLGDFDMAEQYANTALADYSEMLDYASSFWTVDYSGVLYPMTNTYYPWTAPWLQFWTEQYMNRSIGNPHWKTLPSQELLDLYDPADKRFEIFVVENYMQRFGFTENVYPGYIQGGNYAEYIQGPSTGEMYLIRAEIKARKGNISGAMDDVENVRKFRFAAEDYAALPLPADKKAAMKTVIDERRREMPFSIRWYDIRRLNADPETDNITITRKFYTLNGTQVNTDAAPIDYVIEPGSRLFARPLNDAVINLSQGQTKQNEY